MSIDPKNIQSLCEKVKLLIPKQFYLRHDGNFTYRRRKGSRTVNHIIIPKDEQETKQLVKHLLAYIRKGVAELDPTYLLTKDNRIILNSEKTVKQCQIGGYNFKGNVMKRRREGYDNETVQEERMKKKRIRFEKVEELKRQRLEELMLKRKRNHRTKKDKRVNVLYRIIYITHFNDYDSYHTKKDMLHNVLKSKVEDIITDIGQSYCDSQVYDCQIDKYVIEKIESVPRAHVPLREQKMYGIAPSYHYLRVEANESPSLTCVYDFLLQRYGQYIKKLDKNMLMNLFDEGDDKGGVSTNQVIAFCNHYKISIYVVDLDMRLCHQSIGGSSHYPSLVYMVSNQHLYPITDTEVRNTVFAISRSQTSGARVVKYNRTNWNPEKATVLNPGFDQVRQLKNVNVVFTYEDMNTLEQLLLDLYQTDNQIYETVSRKGCVVQIRYKNGVEISLNPDYEISKKDCLKLDIPFKNQNQIQLVLEMFETYKGNDRIHSTFNSHAKDVFFNYKKIPFTHTYYEPNKEANLKLYDIRKCYTACLSVNNKYPFLVYSIFDEVKPFDGTITNGMYYVETESFFPARGTGWYYRVEVECFQEIGLNHRVVYQLIPSRTLPREYFNKFVDRVFDNCENPKFLMNCFIGCSNKKSRVAYQDLFTTDLQDAARTYFSSKGSMYFRNEVNGRKDLYMIRKTTKHEVHENMIPIYFQVIANANIELYKLSQLMGGRIVRLKTDSVLVEDGYPVECREVIGGYKEESKPEHFIVSEPFENNYKFELIEKDWNEEPDGHGMITGLAGTGKTFQVKKIEEQLKEEGKKYVILAPTNTAADLIDGLTIHKYFSIDINGSYEKQKVLRAVDGLDMIIIDEIGMVSAAIFEVLYYISKNSKVKFLFSGDDKQIGATEEIKYDYFNSVVMKELVGYNFRRLTEFVRSTDESLTSLFDKVMELNPSEVFGSNENTRVHICWTNRKRIEVNKRIMDQEVKRLKKKPLLIAKNENDKNSQDVKLLKGFPVMVIRNNSSKGMLNGACYKVSKLNPLTVKNEKREIVISEELFRQYFYIGFCSTAHKQQGKSINESLTIWEWNMMNEEMRYTSISRATSRALINVAPSSKKANPTLVIPDTNHTLMVRNVAESRRMEDPLYRKRKQALSVLSKIVHDPTTSDEYSQEHTGLSRVALLKYLKIENGIPRNYQIDHIKERHKHVTDEEFQRINHYTNLRLLPKIDNIMRNFKTIREI